MLLFDLALPDFALPDSGAARKKLLYCYYHFTEGGQIY